MIAAVAIAAEPPALPQLVEPAGDLAAVVAADRLDEIGFAEPITEELREAVSSLEKL